MALYLVLRHPKTLEGLSKAELDQNNTKGVQRYAMDRMVLDGGGLSRIHNIAHVVHKWGLALEIGADAVDPRPALPLRSHDKDISTANMPLDPRIVKLQYIRCQRNGNDESIAAAEEASLVRYSIRWWQMSAEKVLQGPEIGGSGKGIFGEMYIKPVYVVAFIQKEAEVFLRVTISKMIDPT